MVQVLEILFTFFLATASADHVLVRYNVNERVSIVLSSLFGILCAVFVGATLHI